MAQDMCFEHRLNRSTYGVNEWLNKLMRALILVAETLQIFDSVEVNEICNEIPIFPALCFLKHFT